MQRNPQRAGGGGIPVVAPACKWPAEGVRNTIVSISRREAYVSCHGYAGIQLSAQAEKKAGSQNFQKQRITRFRSAYLSPHCESRWHRD